MKIVIIGGTGRIGSRVKNLLAEQGHNVIAAAPSTGVDTVSGKGLDEALAGAQVVIDVSNAPIADEAAAVNFFETSARNLIASQKKHAVSHYIILSIVGVDRMEQKGYFRSKQAQEKLVKNSGVPYTIVQATQFFEFLGSIAASGVKDETIYLPAALFQPIAADDVASILASVATSKPVNGIVPIAGPEKGTMASIVGKYLKKTGDKRPVLSDPDAGYFGVALENESLVPLEGSSPRIGRIDLDTWIRGNELHAPA